MVYTLSIEATIGLIEGKVSHSAYFKNIDLTIFCRNRKNGKSTIFYFDDPIKYRFDNQSLNKIINLYSNKLLNIEETIFLLEAVTMLEDVWDINNDTLSTILTFTSDIEKQIK